MTHPDRLSERDPSRRLPRKPGIGRERRRPAAEPEDSGTLDVLHNRPFLLLWLAQLATQVGGNMVLYGLAIVISSAYTTHIAVSALMLCFLVPAVIFSAVAGVYVDQMDRRLVLVVTNVLRGVAFVGVALVGGNLLLMYPLVFFVSMVTTFFGPAEASMIPILVPRRQLLAANGIYTLTTNAAFAAGFALFGPFMVSLSSPMILILAVAALYFVAAGLCWTLPPAPPVETEAAMTPGSAVADAERAAEALIGQLAEGVDYIRKNRSIGWSLTYLGVAASLIGVLGVLGPGFARDTLGLGDKDFVVIVLPLGIGIVTGIMALNSYGKYVPRRRLIEGGLIALGILLIALAMSGPMSRFLEGNVANRVQDLGRIVSVLGIVITIGFLAGVGYVFVAVPSQTQLQEDIPEEVRGRIFGILNMLVSIASFLPIILVAPIADLVGTPPPIFVTGILIGLCGILSVVRRGALVAVPLPVAGAPASAPVDPLMAVLGGKEFAPVHVPPRHSGETSGALAESSPVSQHAGAPSGEPVAAGRVEPTPGPVAPESPTAAEPAESPESPDAAEAASESVAAGAPLPAATEPAEPEPAPEWAAPEPPDEASAPEPAAQPPAAQPPAAQPPVFAPQPTPAPAPVKGRHRRRPRGVIRAMGMAEPVSDRPSMGDRLRGAGRALRRTLRLGGEDLD